MSEHLETIQTSCPDIFKGIVNDLTRQGYKIDSTSCGLYRMPDDYVITMYQAILIKTTNQPK